MQAQYVNRVQSVYTRSLRVAVIHEYLCHPCDTLTLEHTCGAVVGRSTPAVSRARVEHIEFTVMLHHSHRQIGCVQYSGAVRAEEHGERLGQIEDMKYSGGGMIMNVNGDPQVTYDKHGEQLAG